MKILNNEKLLLELKRLDNMLIYENRYSKFAICGIDEAGRGPLAGPVVAGACILNREVNYIYVNDSKKLSEKNREELYEFIIHNSLAYGIGVVDNKVIDEINILNATQLAMKKAYIKCNEMYQDKHNKNIDILLVDALNIKDINVAQVSIVKGDEKSLSIASASILAKVYRDRLMIKYNDIFPQYNFIKNKGYGTKEHMMKIKEIGATPIHRKSFLKNI